MFGDIFHGNAVFNCKAYFIRHPSCDLIPEIPQFITLGKQRESGFETELSFFCYFVAQKLCEINVRSDGYRLIFPCHILAKASGFSDVFIHIAPKC